MELFFAKWESRRWGEGTVAGICYSSASDLLTLASEPALCDVVTGELRFSFKCLKLLLMLEKVTSATHFLCH